MDYYKILDIPKTATIEEIKAAYRKKCLEFHPDKCKLPNATQKFIEINAAYRALTDPSYKPKATKPPPPKRDIWGKKEKTDDNLWKRYEKKQTYYPTKTYSKPVEIDLWAQTRTSADIFIERYWKEYNRLKNECVYEEPEVFWNLLDEWTKKNSPKGKK